MAINDPSTCLGLPDIPEGWHFLEASVLADGSLGFLYTDSDLVQEWRRNASGELLGRLWEVAAAARARLMVWRGDELMAACDFPLETPFPRFDRFPDGRWLVVAARTRGEPNARVFNADGALIARFMLGDGIEHVSIDQDDQIWVGWFDEGIYGNDEWKVDGWEWPPSSYGIGCFKPDGAPHPALSFPADAGIIADCYAMNIGLSGNWAVPYMDFPLLRLSPGKLSLWWRNSLAGSKAVALGDDHALLAGGYGADSNLLTLVSLEGPGDGGVARAVATWRLPLPLRIPAPGENPELTALFVWDEPTLLSGRGGTIHLVHGDGWHRWNVSDMLAAAQRAG